MTRRVLNHRQVGHAEAKLHRLLDRGVCILRRLVDINGLQVRLPSTVRSDVYAAMLHPEVVAAPGVHAAKLNQYGAVSTLIGDRCLGLKPGEFHFVCPFVDGDTTLVKRLVKSDKVDSSRWVITPKARGLVKSARLEHLHDLTSYDALHEGFLATKIHEPWTGMTRRGPLVDSLAHAWDAMAPDKSKWVDNPWTWRIDLWRP